MKANLKITIRAFLYFSLVGGGCLGIGFSIYTGKLLKGFILGLLGGFLSSIVISLYLFIGLVLFEKKYLFYSNIPLHLKKRSVEKVYYESVAGNATGVRIKYGGLFLTDTSVLFIPHRFAIKPIILEIPLIEIKEVKQVGINLLKHFSGGLRKRLLFETVTGNRYEFSVLNIDQWTKKINERIRTIEMVSS